VSSAPLNCPSTLSASPTWRFFVVSLQSLITQMPLLIPLLMSCPVNKRQATMRSKKLCCCYSPSREVQFHYIRLRRRPFACSPTSIV
jgi:hypothetical protein